jgi:hypothetical protein
MSHELTSLFSNRVRDDTSYGRHAESTYEYLDRSSRPGVSEVRALLDKWYCLYPTDSRRELRARFIADFHGAFWELFLYAYFRMHSFELTPHPEVPNATRKPDYLASRNDCEFYLEAIVVRDKSDEDLSRERVKNLLLDAINATSSPNFFLALRDFTVKEGKQPVARRISAFLRREVVKFDPDRISEELTANSVLDGPVLVFEDETIRLEVTLVPRSPGARGRGDIRPIGIYPMQTRWGGSDGPIKDAINAKATRYGLLHRPYLVGINCISEWGLDDDDVLDALFGTPQVSFGPGNSEPITSRRSDGAFVGPDGPWNTRVTAVIVGNLYPWGLDAGRFELYHNPWTSNPFHGCDLTVRQASLQGDRLDWKEGPRLLDVFGLPAGWPQQPAA